MKKIVISIIITICILAQSVSLKSAENEKFDSNLLNIYGFIIPNVNIENKTLENEIFCKSRHLINDLLRENISVYRSSQNISVNTTNFSLKYNENKFFEKGAFIIPFTGNDTNDAKIIAIILDYNETCEIDFDESKKIPVLLINEPLELYVYKLNNVKIAHQYNLYSTGFSWYLNVAERCGFLNFKIIKNKEMKDKLDNKIYNVLMWPGGDSYYDFVLQGLTEGLSDLFTKKTKVVRDFVFNGGGYIGSCGGCVAASSGHFPIPMYFKRSAYNPNLKTIYFLAIIDMITIFLEDGPGDRLQIIQNDSNPITFGVDKILINGTKPGPNIMHMGKNVEVIAKFKTDSKYDDTPSIVSSKFGEGKVVAYCGHPEIRDFDSASPYIDVGVLDYSNGKKIVSNSLFYATCDKREELKSLNSHSLSFLTEIKNKTIDIPLVENELKNVFDEIKKSINHTNNKIRILLENIDDVRDIILKIAKKKNININIPPNKNFLYYNGVQYTTNDLSMILRYFENTLKILRKIEIIFPLLEEDIKFISQVEKLKEDLYFNINETSKIISKELYLCKKYNQSTNNYLNSQIFSIIKEKIIRKYAHDIEKEDEKALFFIPNIYFKSLRLLRENWYDYETKIILSS